MTVKAYQNDATTTHFTATITERLHLDQALGLILDQTYFYPEGGGQPNDLGSIGGARVLDVQLTDQGLIHFVDQDPQGDTHECHIDWTRRFDLMQQHTGQHMLSAVLHKDHAAATVGFHLTTDNLTLDIDKVLTDGDYLKVEEAVNALVHANYPMFVHYPHKDQLADHDLRKMPKVQEDIRLVAVGDYDTVPCGGTHVTHTGQVGLIKVKKVEKHKQGQRITFSCGMRAIKEQQEERQVLSHLVSALAVPVGQLPQALNGLYDKINLLEGQLEAFEQTRIHNMATDLMTSVQTIDQVPYIGFYTTDLSSNSFKRLIQTLTDDFKGVLVAATFYEGSGQVLVSSGPYADKVNAKSLIQSLNQLGLKGGGSPQRAQAGTKSQDDLYRAFEHLKIQLGLE